MRFSLQTQEARPPRAGGLLGRNGGGRTTRHRPGGRAAPRAQLSERLVGLTLLLLPLIIPSLYVFTVARHSAFVIGITNVDYFPQVDWALRLQWGAWEEWVNWKWPAGMAWLIRMGLGLGIDVSRFGQALSMFGGALGLLGTYLLARAATGSLGVALVCQAFVALNPTYLFYGGFEGTDMPAAGLQILSLGCLALGLQIRETSPRGRLLLVALAGLSAGLAYPIRYTAMLTIATGGLVLVAAALGNRRASDVRTLVLFGGGSLVGAAPQWIPTWIVTGRPLNNDQGPNVWFDVFQKTDYIGEWNQAPPGITTLGVFLLDPSRFVSHWWSNFSAFWVAPDWQILVMPLMFAGQVGLGLLALLGRNVPLVLRMLLLLYVLLHVVALSIMHLEFRFLLVLLPVLTLGAAWPLAMLLAALSRRLGRWSALGGHAAGALVAMAGLIVAIPVALPYATSQPRLTDKVTVASDVLRGAGLQNPNEVLSTELDLQDLGDPTRLRYPQAYWVAPGHESLTALLDDARSKRFRFLLYGRDGPRSYPKLTDLARPESRPAGLIPIYSDPVLHQLAIYRLAPEIPPPPPVSLQFDGGVALAGVRVTAARRAASPAGWMVGVYLRWAPQNALPRSYKVFVHLVDEQGRLVAQDDGVPAVWTYPTTAWKGGETLIDFHSIALADPIPARLSMLVGLYDEQTGERLGRLDAGRERVDDKAHVGTLTLEGGAARFRPLS